ncbi:hypothetical protein NFI96_016573, partial [Prochilodus magdalenae]
MKCLLLLTLTLHLAAAVPHSLQYLYTAVSPGTDFPEFSVVGLLDGEQVVYYDSYTRRMIPKMEWMENNEGEEYWDSETQTSQRHQENFRTSMADLVQRFNQTEGVHTLQWTYGCELRDDGSRREYFQYGYDGEDFISLDLDTETWTAANARAVTTKHKWEGEAWAAQVKNYLRNTCMNWLWKHVDYYRFTVEMRGTCSLTVPLCSSLPKVDLFQKNSSSPVVCHATGFHPKPIIISWQKNGEDLDEGVELRETLPNQDGTFQKRSILTVSPEELDRNYYTCVIQFSRMYRVYREYRVYINHMDEMEYIWENLYLHVSERRVLQDGSSGLYRIIFIAVAAALLLFSLGMMVKKCAVPYRSPYIRVTPGRDFPEFTTVGVVDREQTDYYDSNITTLIPKAEWMEKIGADDPEYWNRSAQNLQHDQETFRVSLDVLQQRFNHTGGVHTVQWMYGCELDDDGTKRGHMQFGYDGEDFLSLDLDTETWTAANPKAVITKHKWEGESWGGQVKAYLENTCTEWLQKYVGYGRSTLERRVPPEVSLFQKDSSSPVVCHATGFFPKPVMIYWQENGEDLDEDVELRETLPNQDGTFQKRSVLTVSPEELDKHTYTCVIQHSSLEKEMVLHVSNRRVLTKHQWGALLEAYMKPSLKYITCLK